MNWLGYLWVCEIHVYNHGQATLDSIWPDGKEHARFEVLWSAYVGEHEMVPICNRRWLRVKP